MVAQDSLYNIALGLKNINIAVDNLNNDQFCQLRSVAINNSLTAEEKYIAIQNNSDLLNF